MELLLDPFFNDLWSGITSSKTLVISPLVYVFVFYRIYLLYLAYCIAFSASLCKVPYGFFTILTGDKLIPAFVVWPFKNGGYLSSIWMFTY